MFKDWYTFAGLSVIYCFLIIAVVVLHYRSVAQQARVAQLSTQLSTQNSAILEMETAANIQAERIARNQKLADSKNKEAQKSVLNILNTKISGGCEEAMQYGLQQAMGG